MSSVGGRGGRVVIECVVRDKGLGSWGRLGHKGIPPPTMFGGIREHNSHIIGWLLVNECGRSDATVGSVLVFALTSSVVNRMNKIC